MSDARRLARLRRLPKGLASAVEPVIREAARSGVRAALVGGIVRDLVRGERAGRDIDLVVEGDACRLADRAASAVAGGRVTRHARFGTARIDGEAGFRIDLATARRERYARPGALPEVQPASIEEDLGRRDFTVNAIAWEPASGRLLDPFGGASDLAGRRLRVLHDRSFLDDPTRMFRAARYASRLDLTLEARTRRLLRAALAAGALTTVSGDRLRNEVAKLLGETEPDAAAALRSAGRLGLLAALEDEWRVSAGVARALRRAADLEARVGSSSPEETSGSRPRWIAGLLVAASDLRGPGRERLANRLALSGEARRIFERWPAPTSSKGSREEAIARAALAPTAGERRLLARRLASPVRLSIGGVDLIDSGVPGGPAIGHSLGETLRALEEGRLEPGRASELAFALAAARRPGRSDLAGSRRASPPDRLGFALVGPVLVLLGLAAARAGHAAELPNRTPGARGSGMPSPTPLPTSTATPAATSRVIPTQGPAATATPTPTPPSRRTFCVEWIRQTREGFERVTLFADRMLVWKTSRDGKEELLRKQLAPEELTFYCDYFSSDESFAIPSDLRTGLSGDFAPTSSITLARADGLKRTIRFDDFSPLTAQAAGIRAALEGLKTMMTSPLAPASRFAPDVLAVGQILKRFDGAYFRIRTLEKEKGIVEIEGVREPYREFRRIEDLRFQFSPPE